MCPLSARSIVISQSHAGSMKCPAAQQPSSPAAQPTRRPPVQRGLLGAAARKVPTPLPRPHAWQACKDLLSHGANQGRRLYSKPLQRSRFALDSLAPCATKIHATPRPSGRTRFARPSQGKASCDLRRSLSPDVHSSISPQPDHLLHLLHDHDHHHHHQRCLLAPSFRFNTSSTSFTNHAFL
jgi:hypothetical protein